MRVGALAFRHAFGSPLLGRLHYLPALTISTGFPVLALITVQR